MLKSEANVDSQANNGQTSLYETASNGHTVVVKLLLEYGVETDITASGGQTVLHAARVKGHDHVVKVLLSKKSEG